MGSILRAIELPETGGDTLFASVQAAYDGLTDETKEMIETLKGTHSSRHIFGYEAGRGSGSWRPVRKRRPSQSRCGAPSGNSPIPETGRKGIYVNAAFTTGIEGKTKEESDGILDKLYF